MHTLLSPRLHGVIDYVAVALFALAPSLLGLDGLAATLSYALAAIHLLMTLATAFPLGVVALVPFRLHGTVELAVGGALVLAGVLAFDGAAQGFFVAMGAVILAVWAATTYDGDGV
ncbi:hypothetical protein [Rubrivirga sp. IMCC43871]|uniref:hypothetical protein n=1 Tax=Rubrivirga sp. IMCC43871 TaxID=3391575 RepID=UPI003990011D